LYHWNNIKFNNKNFCFFQCYMWLCWGLIYFVTLFWLIATIWWYLYVESQILYTYIIFTYFFCRKLVSLLLFLVNKIIFLCNKINKAPAKPHITLKKIKILIIKFDIISMIQCILNNSTSTFFPLSEWASWRFQYF
jgi:hypothetical protein